MKFENIFKSNTLKVIRSLFIVLFIIVMIGGCQSKVDKVETITLASSSENIDINAHESFTYTIEPKNIKIKKENIIFDDSDMLELESMDDHSITLKTTNKTGNTSFHITANDISSNKISLEVVDKKKETEDLKAKQEKEAKAIKEQEEKEQQARIQEEQRIVAENARIQEEQQRQANTQTPNESPVVNPNVATVYITKTGSKYHSHANCGNSKTARSASLDEALSLNLGPCQKCY